MLEVLASPATCSSGVPSFTVWVSRREVDAGFAFRLCSSWHVVLCHLFVRVDGVLRRRREARRDSGARLGFFNVLSVGSYEPD